MADNDNTCILRMKRDFDDYISKSRSEANFGRKKLCLDDSQVGANSGDLGDISMTTALTELDKSIEAKKQAAELAHAKGRVLQLESKLNQVETLHKKSSVEHDTELARLRQELQSLRDDAANASHQLSLACKREQSLAEQLTDARESADKARISFEERILILQREKTLIVVQHGQVEEELRQKYAETKTKLMREQAEKELARSELSELMEQHSAQAKKLKELQTRQKENELVMHDKLSAAERQVRELTDQLATYADDRGRVAAAYSDLQQLHKYHAENEKLRLENKQLRDTQENVHLLKEMLESANQKLQRYEARLQQTAQIEADSETLKSRIRELESCGADSTMMLQRSPLVSKRIAEFQCKEAVHLALQGDLRESLHYHQNRANTLEAELHKLNAQHAGCTNRALQQTELIKRLQRKLGAVSQERNAYKRMLDTFDGGVTADVATVGNSKLAVAEQVAASCRAMVQSLEEDLSKKSEELFVCQRRCAELEDKLSEGTADASSGAVSAGCRKDSEAEADRQTISQLRADVEALHKTVEHMSNEKAVFEMRLERLHMQGDYDPTTTKVIHMKMNPLTQLQNHRAAERERLRAENERLKERLKLMEDAVAAGERPHDLTAVIEQRLKDPNASAEEFQAQLMAAENKYQRLTETYKQATKDYREGVYILTGYKIDMPQMNQFSVMSQYAETPNDYLQFQHERGAMELLDTSYARSLRELTEQHLKQSGIPVFLSALTMELYSRQTVCCDDS